MTEILNHPPQTVALAAFTGASVLALLLVLLPSPVFSPDARIRSETSPPAISRADLEQPPITAYAVIADRPLFNVGRKKDVAPLPVAVATLPALTSYRLAGIVLSSQTRLALVEKIPSKQIVTLKPGDMLDGRHVDDVEEGTVVFSAQGATEILTIPRISGWSRAGDTPQASTTTAITK